MGRGGEGRGGEGKGREEGREGEGGEGEGSHEITPVSPASALDDTCTLLYRTHYSSHPTAGVTPVLTSSCRTLMTL